jgi:hypothetical protein
LAAAGGGMEDGDSATYSEEGLETVDLVGRMGDVADGELGGVVLGSADDVLGWGCVAEVLGEAGVTVIELGADPGGLGVAKLDEGAEGVARVLRYFLAEEVGAGDALGEVAGAVDAEVEAREYAIEGRFSLGLGLRLTG